MHRAQAAAVLGVGDTATPDEIRRAFRLWAAALHPDAGGSEAAFARLCEARAVLLAPADPDPVEASPQPPPRQSWRDVLVRPTARDTMVLALLVVGSLGVVLAAPLATMPWGLVGAAVSSTATCVVASRTLLRNPDHGHVIVLRAIVWIALTTMQCAIAAMAGIPAFEALPLLAVPFVACISLVNPGAGLWRPARPAR